MTIINSITIIIIIDMTMDDGDGDDAGVLDDTADDH